MFKSLKKYCKVNGDIDLFYQKKKNLYFINTHQLKKKNEEKFIWFCVSKKIQINLH